MGGVDTANHLLARAYRHGMFSKQQETIQNSLYLFLFVAQTRKWPNRILELLICMTCVNGLILYRRNKGEYKEGFRKKYRRTSMNDFKCSVQQNLLDWALKQKAWSLRYDQYT